ncbi:MAG: hypothetical protein ABGX83_02085 [Nitrospira sp.]|nr:hypothetical protein [Candidatus Manganitrophaceae bacterium]HIL34503.1 hypothetical protein [Candidatus Manganitrophaceae bacterium]
MTRKNPALLEFAQVSRLSHLLEELLDDVRLGKRSFSEEMRDILGDEIHLLHTMIEYARAGKDEQESTLSRLRVEQLKSALPFRN